MTPNDRDEELRLRHQQLAEIRAMLQLPHDATHQRLMLALHQIGLTDRRIDPDALPARYRPLEGQEREDYIARATAGSGATRTMPASGRGDFAANMEWAKAHGREHADKWIALRDGELLDEARTLGQLQAHMIMLLPTTERHSWLALHIDADGKVV